MKILITGVNGFIGRHLSNKLLERRHSVVGLGRNKKTKIKLSDYYSGDILDKNILENIIKNVEVVVHLAALTSHKDITENISKAREINFTGTKNILEVFSKSKTAKKFLYSSTGKVYGKISQLPITENHPTNPLNILGKSKFEVEELIKSFANNNKNLVVFRIFNVYGPSQNENFLIPTIIKQLSRNKGEVILGDIEAERDYVYIDDVVDAFVLAIERKIPSGLSIYNICTGVGTSASQIIDLISEVKNTKIKIKINPNLIRTNEMKREYGSFEKAQKELGWEPKMNLKEGLRKLCRQ